MNDVTVLLPAQFSQSRACVLHCDLLVTVPIHLIHQCLYKYKWKQCSVSLRVKQKHLRNTESIKRPTL